MLRVGIDLVEIGRIEEAVRRWGGRFLERVFTPGELEQCAGSAPSLAARFAAKEAAAKALGTGLMTRVAWSEIEVLRGDRGEPRLSLRGAARDLARELGLTDWAVSLSHTGDQAIAVVVAQPAPSSHANP